MRRKGFLLLVTLLLALAVGMLMLNWYQQSIQNRYQTSAFLKSQVFFQELNSAVLHSIHHFRKHTAEELTNRAYPLTEVGFPENLSHWSTSTFTDDAMLRVTLLSAEEPDSQGFELLLKVKEQKLSDRPWYLFHPEQWDLPSILDVVQESEALLQWEQRPFWLPEIPDVTQYDQTLGNVALIDLEGSMMEITHDNGTVKQFSLPLSGYRMRIQSSATTNVPIVLQTHFDSLIPELLLLQTDGPVDLQIEDSSGFPENPPVLFVDSGKSLTLRSANELSQRGEVSGYFRVRGKPCIQLEGILAEVYWKGSLICDHPPDENGKVRLKHNSFSGSIPTAFTRHYLHANGIRLLNE